MAKAFNITTGKWEEASSAYLPPLPVPPPVPQELSFSQFVIGLAELGWITDAEAETWLAGNGLPAGVEAVLSQLPASAPGGVKPRLRARARAMRPSVIERNNELLLMMAQARGATAEQLDDFFHAYVVV